MKHFIAIISKQRSRRFLNVVVSRQASTGVNLFMNKDNLTQDIKEKIESYWRDKINLHKYDENVSNKEKVYVLSMFPYPSGVLHMGHIRIYTVSDIVARFYRMKGKNVLHPMGWDAFGLPAENAAIEKQVDPAEWTRENINKMRQQLNTLNYSFDWKREIATCDREYYKWTQELFLRLFEKKLIYRKDAYVNWDPVDQTVLAEEQIDANDVSWRSGAKVEKKLLNQWFVRTTAFAKSLLEGLNNPMLKGWKDIIKIQRNWIGDCDGVSFDFKLTPSTSGYPKTINLWTKHPEFIEFAKFVAISPDSILNQFEYHQDTSSNIKQLSFKAINPFNEEELPIFITDKISFPVLRDNHLGIPSASMTDLQFAESIGIPFQRHGIRSHEEFQKKHAEILQKAREWNIGGYSVSSRLTDWLISRQRYWGTPIPIIHCESCGAQPVPRDQLPLTLPKIKKDDSSSLRKTLLDAKDWLQTRCPNCGGDATREADTMDTFVDSCWYFLRYTDPRNEEEIFSIEKARKALPVDLYIGGKEHALLHLYYARFMNHFLYNEGLVPTPEPFKQLLVQGMVMGKTYQVQSTGQYLKEDEVETNKADGTCEEKVTGKPVRVFWEKMSKSRHNGVDPLELLREYGIDVTRLLITADVAPTSHRNWSLDTIPGIKNWQSRLWLTVCNFLHNRQDTSLEDALKAPTHPNYNKDDEYMFDSRNFFLKMTTFNIVESQQLSIAISRMQGLTNSLRKVCKECTVKSKEFERALAVQIIMLAPFAPHFASELWAGFCSAPYHLIDKEEVQLDKDVSEQAWPEIDLDYKMTMKVHANNQLLLNVKIPRRVLDKLTAMEASEFISTQSAYKKLLRTNKVEDVKLLSIVGCDANLYITTSKIKKEISL